ncbi:hypothetical protein GGD46_001533 [Rhizobium lusitanum]|uniref:Uncharacterized protein n=1 Tax=Rhizobium lusitanum TaxID=293958 RepID=A0A7X0MB08_9HYPH|nr:hypothetical protein [Rhizobium lusitanum]
MAFWRITDTMTGTHAGVFEGLRSSTKMVHTNTGRSFHSHRLSQGKGPGVREEIGYATTSNLSSEDQCPRR